MWHSRMNIRQEMYSEQVQNASTLLMELDGIQVPLSTNVDFKHAQIYYNTCTAMVHHVYSRLTIIIAPALDNEFPIHYF